MAASSHQEECSDYESSCSSVAGGGPSSRRSWISDNSSVSGDTAAGRFKPHKANQAEWKAIRRLQATSGGHVGLEHFRLVRRLGSGDLGSVYLCRLRDGGSSSSTLGSVSYYAMKVVDREALALKKKLQRAEAEREILKTLDHPFLPTLYADFDASHYSCLVMEFCPGGDLHVARQRQPTKRFPISSAKFYAAETLVALEYLHMMGVIYRDLKPENVLVRDDGHIMLSDFDLSLKCDVVPRLLQKPMVAHRRNGSTGCGRSPTSSPCVAPIQPVLSCFYGGAGGKCTTRWSRMHPSRKREGAIDENDDKEEEDEGGDDDLEPEVVAEPMAARSKSFVGTHEYLAPEVISGAGHGGPVDWWTLGVFLYEMIYGRTPFKGENNEKTLINIIKQPVSFPAPISRTTGLNGGWKELEELSSAQDLITKLLVKNPKKRIGSSRGSVEIKRHAFFKGVNWALIRSTKPPMVPRDHTRPRMAAAAALTATQSLSKKERKEAYHVPAYFDFF